MSTLSRRLLFACLATLLAAPGALAQSEGVAWRTDFRAACAEAQQSGKLVLAHFWTESCAPCKLLEKRVFAQPSVGVALAGQYVPVRINANEAPELAQAYGVSRVPTDAVVTPDGTLVKSFISPGTPMEYVGYVNQVAAAYRTQLGSPYAAAVAQAPDQSGLKPQRKPGEAPAPDMTQAYARLMAQTTPAAVAAPASPTTPPAAPRPTQPPASNNPYASQPPAAQVAQAPAPVANPAYQQQQPITPAAPVAPAPQRPTVQQTALQLPPGSPPLGFEGFCPVTMKNEWRWAKGDTRFGAIHQGRTYLFATADSQKAFLAKPDNFSPVLSGSDPVAAVDERRQVAGVREYAVEYQGRFYLFSSEQTLEKFWTDPTAYADGAERVAALPAGDAFIR